jgi:undecaprenyl-diphosphatase
VPILHAVVLGLVQGFTEFLPISSSGHLILVPWLFGWEDFDDPSIKKAFDVALHIGTLVAVVAYYRHDLWRYLRAGLAALRHPRGPHGVDARLGWLILLATLPAAAVGALFEEFIDDTLGTPFIIALSLIGFGLLLEWADRAPERRPADDFRTRDAVIVGAAQALALNPGTSRSGITITAARRLGFTRQGAARLSFLMSVPVIAGAVVFKLAGLAADGVPEGFVGPMLVGIVTSGIAGWVAIWGTLRYVSTRSFRPFVVYRVGLGVVVLLLVAAGWG